MQREFGHIENVFEGDLFKNRLELSEAKVHRPTQAGISGSEKEGADSIVISGGYEDDKDFGDEIIYTGHGGRSNDSKTQVADQTLTRQNKALVHSYENGYPIRVIRGANSKSVYAPAHGYRYDGLYRVEKYWKDIGKSNFIIWLFRLEKITQTSIDSATVEEPTTLYSSPKRSETLIQRIIRNTYTAIKIKELYNFKCQICSERIQTQIGYYAEAAHIKPLGVPHNGPDVIENLLCLCPNHHVMFDNGVITIEKDYSILGLKNRHLTLHRSHKIKNEFIQYHQEHFYFETTNNDYLI